MTKISNCLKENNEGKPRVYSIENLEKFINIATWLYSDDNVIFRGQTKEKDWPLVPSVGRKYERTKVPWKEDEIFQEFKREAIPYLSYIPYDDNTWQWLAIAQHNRLPTRLIDWTKNPLVALWFAVKDKAIDNLPGVVWALYYEDNQIISNTKNLQSPFAIDKIYVYYPEHAFPNIQAQSSVFTIHPSIEDGIEDGPVKFSPLEETWIPEFITKIEITPDSFQTIRFKLFQLGINPAYLFPGLSGIVDKIRYKNILMDDEGELE